MGWVLAPLRDPWSGKPTPLEPPEATPTNCQGAYTVASDFKICDVFVKNNEPLALSKTCATSDGVHPTDL